MAKQKTPPETTSPPDKTYTVLARRYRPQQFADLAGQEAVVKALVNAIESNRVAHAYVFTGARGVGKTSTARILAKALNCVRGWLHARRPVATRSTAGLRRRAPERRPGPPA